MSEAAVIHASSVRVRAVSLASSALIVTLICVGLVLLSRVAAYLEHQPVAGIQVEIAPRAPPPRRTAPRTSSPPQDVIDPDAAPTPIPLSRDMFARTLRCLSLRDSARRPPDCPPIPEEQLAISGGVFPNERQRDPRALMTRAERQIEAFMDTGPCQGVCIPIGPPPPPPTRSPEAVCRDGLVGPCATPIFRAEDVVRQPHTQ